MLNFQTFFHKIFKKRNEELTEMTDAGVLGNDGPYDTSDARTPAILGTYSRKGKIKNKRRKRKNKI